MAQSQKYMMYIVPFFSLTGLYWQYGLVLYWVTTNLWTLGQQYFMFRNWTVEDTQPASATASAGSPVRATQSSLRPSSGAAKTAAGSAKPAAAGKPAAGSKPAAAAKPAVGATKTAGASRPAGSTRPASGNGRPAGAAARPKAASSAATATSGSSGGPPRPATPQTGSARTDAAAAAATPDGGAKRSLLRLGRQKQEPAPEPEVPVAKVVRQQPVRQARSKRSGKR